MRPRHLALGLAAWAAGALIAFRDVFLSSFDKVFGSPGDARLIVFLHEHMYDVLRGRAEWLSPPFYYPQTGVLGYTDAFLLDAPPYAALRAVGLDPFLSFQLWVIVLSLGAFLASQAIAMRYLRLRWPLAVSAALLVTFPNNLMFKTAIGHVNFFALYYVPCILLLTLSSVEHFPRMTWWATCRLALASALFGLLLGTTYNIAWWLAFTGIIAASSLVVARPDLRTLGRCRVKSLRRAILAAGAGFAIGAVPFALIYFPVLSLFHGRTYRDFLVFAPFPKHVIDVSTANLVWGRLVAFLLGDSGAERTLAVTPVMTALLLVMALRQRRVAKRTGTALPAFALACVSVWLVSGLLTARIGTVSLFWPVYYLVPGAAGIRAVGRVQLLVNLWVAAGLTVSLQAWIDEAPTLGRRRLAGLAILICLVEQVNLMPPRLSRSWERAFLESVAPPPPECTAFLLEGGSPDDALWISARTGLPTLEGTSGWWPPGWKLNDARIDHRAAAREWIVQTGLRQRVCTYDRPRGIWSTFH